jgi:peptide deformylase
MPDLKLATFPHPVLRRKSKPIARVDNELREIVDQMFAMMYENSGVGLAANQVELPLRLFVCNPTGVKGEGPELVFINPVISQPRGIEELEEGCLSLPGVRAQVKRSKTIWVNAYDLQGKEIKEDFSGFMARIIQHETDHLDGVMFIDRLTPERLRSLEIGLGNLAIDHESRQRTGSMAADEALLSQADAWEKKYC